MDLLAAFVARYARVRVTMFADLREGRIDVVVLNLIEDDRDPYSEPILQDRLVAFVRDTHSWAGRAGITLFELGGAPSVLREAGSATRAALLAALNRAGLSPHVALELGSRRQSGTRCSPPRSTAPVSPPRCRWSVAPSVGSCAR
jgi:DNA-binding transcriptional LysR family regulator